MSDEKQAKQATQPKRTIQEKKMELAAERGSIVIIPNSGDEMFCMIFLLRQMDNAFTRLNKASSARKSLRFFFTKYCTSV